jgi:hypothetical protein
MALVSVTPLASSVTRLPLPSAMATPWVVSVICWPAAVWSVSPGAPVPSSGGALPVSHQKPAQTG